MHCLIVRRKWGGTNAEAQRIDIEDLEVFVTMDYCGRLRG